MWTELSDTAILNKLGTRLKASRISSGLKQQELAAESGVGVSTIAKIESGQSVSLSLLISVMRTLGLLENLRLACTRAEAIANGTVEDAGQAGKTRKNKEGLNNGRNTSNTDIPMGQPCGSHVVG